MEIERKFLIPSVPDDIELVGGIDYEQAYLCTEPVVRVRREGGEFWLTYKSKGLMIREECNMPLTEKGYYHLLSKADSPIIRKVRYFIPLDEKHVIELDRFKGSLSPLMMAEVEFSDEADALSFEAPDWFGREVTDDASFQNVNLAFSTIEELSL